MWVSEVSMLCLHNVINTFDHTIIQMSSLGVEVNRIAYNSPATIDLGMTWYTAICLTSSIWHAQPRSSIGPNLNSKLRTCKFKYEKLTMTNDSHYTTYLCVVEMLYTKKELVISSPFRYSRYHKIYLPFSVHILLMTWLLWNIHSLNLKLVILILLVWISLVKYEILCCEPLLGKRCQLKKIIYFSG